MAEGNFLKSLVALIECPICYETPKSADKTVGVCYLGHIVCKTCYNAMQETPHSCPQCRRVMFMSQNNYIVNGILAIIEQGQIFTCTYDQCNFRGHAAQMVQHEKSCSWRPIKCVRKECNILTPFKSLAHRTHACLARILRNPNANAGFEMTWEFILHIRDVFDMEQNTLCLSRRFLPQWLSLPYNLNWRAYFYPIIRRNTLILAVGWMSRKEASPTLAHKAYYKLAVSLDSKWGFVTQDNLYYTDSIDPYKNMADFDIIEQEEAALQAKYGPVNPIKISIDDLREWISQCQHDICNTCKGSIGKCGPHLHVCVDMKTVVQ